MIRRKNDYQRCIPRRKLGTKEASEYSGVSVSTLTKLRCLSSNGPRFAKLGRRVVYDPQDLDNWI
ncbi:helix-turn-helix domain-containing protein [Rhodomicrobium udaipurense]|uniref:Helix-turn-helix domain-containing protein n=1 Tax=Rhodomicrobium udaipurense TaxID=1202716 RepID=A0A8I1GG93_9HYPH|nr:helix-turn-helix domain-containing protein [Rhodomicrobium udaipurense]